MDDPASAINCTNASESVAWGQQNCSRAAAEVDLLKAGSLALILVTSLLFNATTIAILSRFKVFKVPDVLVIGLACTDLIATCIPIPMTLYAYVTLLEFSSFACNFYATVAQFTRYASALIVTLVSVERYFAVNRPFIYRRYATPLRFVYILAICWLAAFVLALAPALDRATQVTHHDGFCLFDFTTYYALGILAYATVLFVVVVVCFVLVMVNLLKVYLRRKKMKVQGQVCRSISRAAVMEEEQQGSYCNTGRARLSSKLSDISKSLRIAGPVISERMSLGVEAQFARMLFAVVALFYISWTTIVLLIVVAQIRHSQEGLTTALFWGIRLTVISTTINPLLYSLLARQYRTAYAYVFRLALSRCCCGCVNPPLKNVFAAARNPIGEIASRSDALKRRRTATLSDERKLGGAVWASSSHGGLQDSILPETDYSSVFVDSTDNTPAASELCSITVTHPEVGEEGEMETSSRVRLSSSAQDVRDALLHAMATPSIHGSVNPLAIISDLHGEAAVEEGGGEGVWSEGVGGEGARLKQTSNLELGRDTGDAHPEGEVGGHLSRSIPMLLERSYDASAPYPSTARPPPQPTLRDGSERHVAGDCGQRERSHDPLRRHSALDTASGWRGEKMRRTPARDSLSVSGIVGGAGMEGGSIVGMAPCQRPPSTTDNSDSGRESMTLDPDQDVAVHLLKQ